MSRRTIAKNRKDSRTMGGIGVSIGETGNAITDKRIRNGECPTCGNKTHKVRMLGRKHPLTIEGLCRNGRCLKCHPIEGYQRRPPGPRPPPPKQQQDPLGGLSYGLEDAPMPAPAAPPAALPAPPFGGGDNYEINVPVVETRQGFDPRLNNLPPPPQMAGPRPPVDLPFMTISCEKFDDDATQITMDYELIEGYRRMRHKGHHEDMIEEEVGYGNGEDMGMGRPRLHPPEPSLYPDDARPTQRPRPGSAREASLRARTKPPLNPRLAAGVEPHQGSSGRRQGSQHDLYPMESLAQIPPRPLNRYSDIGGGPEPYKLGVPGRPSLGSDNDEEKHEEEAPAAGRFMEPSESYVQSGGSRTDAARPPPEIQYMGERPGALSQRIPSAQTDEPPLVPGRGQPDQDHQSVIPLNRTSGRSVVERDLLPVAANPRFGSADRSMDTNQTLKDIPTLVNHLRNVDTTNNRLRESAFQSLSEIVWKFGQKAKILVKQNYGLEALLKNMWEDMTDLSVQAAATEFLFSLSISFDAQSTSDILVGEVAESAVDALLIVMQTNISVESIQRSGCGALSCLASASSHNPQVSDGALTGAVLCVANAMDNHRTSKIMQIWGLRALHGQCLLSVNAESNKTNLSNFDNFGVNVIVRALQMSQSDLVAAEQACRLMWCLSSSSDFAERLSALSTNIYALVDAARLHQGKVEAASLHEASFGTLVNLTKDSSTHQLFHETGILAMLFQSMRFYRDPDNEGVCVEACALLANLAISPTAADQILHESGIDVIAQTMQAFPLSAEMQSEALRCLLTLAVDDPHVKAKISSDQTLSLIMHTSGRHEESVQVQLAIFKLLCSMSTERSVAPSLIRHGVVPTSIASLEMHQNERRLVETIVGTWRNVTCHSVVLSEFARQDTIAKLVNAMVAHVDWESLQINTCYSLWNICSHIDEEEVRSRIVDAGAVGAIVKTIQAHPESPALLEAACGAIWTIASDSNDVQDSIMLNSGIDAVVCTMMMHPTEERVLEIALGVLSNLSGIESIAKAIGEAQGVSIVVETMRNFPAAISLLELGALTLRNVVLFNPEFDLEVAGGISTIINAMKDHPEAVDFQKEACNALWAMAAQSEDCKSKIVALEGTAVLMETLENDQASLEVKEAARAAFNQLAMLAV